MRAWTLGLGDAQQLYYCFAGLLSLSSPGSYGGLIVKCVLHGVKSYIEMIVRCACRRVHHPGRSPGSDRSVCKLVSGGTWLFRTMVPHSRGRGDLGDGTNLDRGISQP